MTTREQEILQWISENPLISQKELAEKANITRSSVGVHISNLVKKGKIIGKGYVLAEDCPILVIGGSNIDIAAQSYAKVKMRDSNPGSIATSFGGVGRNIAENLARLGEKVAMLTIVGDDVNGRALLDHCRSLNMDMSQALVLADETTSTYISILDEDQDMQMAISAMDIYAAFTPEFIDSKKERIQQAKLCIVDTNLPQETLFTLAELCEKHQIPLFVDLVSTTKALKVKNFIGKFHTIKPNKLEAEILSGIAITDEDSLIKNCRYFLKQGVKNIFISLGKDGVFYSDGKIFHHQKAFTTEVVNATGAGDAFMAGISYAFHQQMPLEEACRFGISCATLTLQSIDTISPNLTLENANLIKEKLCL